MPNVMYHFVGGDENLKGISLRNFRDQLDFLKSTYPEHELALTFDHGTLDHIDFVAPELERRGLKGLFFILTMCPEEGRVATIDKQRFLESTLRSDLARMVCTALKMEYCPETARDYLADFTFYTLEERYLRYLRDLIIPHSTYERFIESHFSKAFGEEKKFTAANYLSWDHIIELRNRGHIIGAHAHYHIGNLEDYSRAIQLIENRINAKVEDVSYPNGVKKVSDEELRSSGIKRAYLSTERGEAGPYRIGRIDCNLEIRKTRLSA